MKKLLERLFSEAKGSVVDYNGLKVHGAVFRRVEGKGRFVVRFVKAVPEPVQALRINITEGRLTIAGEAAPKMVLRLDTCPDVVEVEYRPAPKGSRLTFYNAWIDENDQIDAWVMHAGMLVEEEGNKILLRCSDGRGDPTFDDLVVEIEFLEDEEPRPAQKTRKRSGK